jgi:hypothetical protein
VFYEAIPLFAALGGRITREMKAARTVIDMKYGFDAYEEYAERSREEERELERRLEHADHDEREYRRKALETWRRTRQSALMMFGRSILAEGT